MNRKITIQQFAESVSEVCGMSQQETLEAIRSVFAVIADKLHSGTPVDVPGLGEFALSHDTDERVLFTPAATLADTINGPFSSFEPVELSEEFTEEESEEEPEEEPEEESGEEAVEEIAQEIAAEIADEPVESAPEPPSEPSEPSEPIEPAKEPEAAPESAQLPPPFDPLKAYSLPTSTVAEDKEIFVEPIQEAPHPRVGFVEGIVTGLVIAAAIGVLGLFVYQMFIM